MTENPSRVNPRRPTPPEPETTAHALAEPAPTREITRLLLAWSHGDREAYDRLMPLVYDYLHHMARGHMSRERPDHTLQPTALVHEAYLRLIDQKRVCWQDRRHFFALASTAMRRVLLNHARARLAAKRRGDSTPAASAEHSLVSEQRAEELIALDEALSRLTRIDPRQSRTVELRFFAGLTLAETAEVLNVSPATVKLDWRLARAWLQREMQ